MKALEALLAHYKAHERQSVVVPELKDENGQPMRVFWQLLTIQERDEMRDGDMLGDVDVVIRKAQDIEGKPLFKAEDKLKMQKAGAANVLNRLARMMLSGDAITAEAVEDARKN
jgi:hypothetical protein